MVIFQRALDQVVQILEFRKGTSLRVAGIQAGQRGLIPLDVLTEGSDTSFGRIDRSNSDSVGLAVVTTSWKSVGVLLNCGYDVPELSYREKRVT